MSRLIDRTVWGRDSIPPTELRFRGLVRFVLPVTDLCVGIWASIMTSALRPPAATHTIFSLWWLAAVAVAAFVSAIAVVVPKFWGFEIVSRLTYVALIAGYLLVRLLLASADQEPAVAASVVLSAVLLWLPGWRVADLGYVWWTRRHKDAP